MPFCKQYWRPWATVALALATGGALCTAQAKPSESKAEPSAPQARKGKAEAAAASKSRKSAAKEPRKSAPATARAASSPVAASHGNAEERLLKVIDLVRQQKLDASLQAAASLTSDVPHFQAAQLVYADLLRYKTGHAGALPAAPVQQAVPVLVKHAPAVAATAAANAAGPTDSLQQLHGLQDEIKRRVQGASALPATGSIPAEFLALAPTVRQAIAIDASKSRLYLFKHEAGKLVLTADYYVSVGKLGMGKLEEGDQRTPEGMYFIGRQIAGAKLPEFYGKGALTVNYPNDWDRAMGRSGSGIWLHGSPPEQFARLPQASDGCMVLSNTDLLRLMRSVDKFAPVLVRDRLQWVASADAGQARERDAFLQVLTRWQQSWNQGDAAALGRLYAPELRSADDNKPMQERMAAAFKSANTQLQDVSVYAWKDAKGEIRIANFRLQSRNLAEPWSLRQYWRKTGNEWVLFSEDVQG
ncbi:L,D-transpeptidase family protein [Comamonas sp. J-3]|uniref:L,D-transpeptidase family protein n=1 Tax=Comamonas trifloxystrobinivorans TaxID=3350256 RepID=UPI003728CE1F